MLVGAPSVEAPQRSLHEISVILWHAVLPIEN